MVMPLAASAALPVKSPVANLRRGMIGKQVEAGPPAIDDGSTAAVDGVHRPDQGDEPFNKGSALRARPVTAIN